MDQAMTELPPELRVTLAESEPLESASAAVRACAVGNGLLAERATRLQVVVEELLREAREREKVGDDGAISVAVVIDERSLRVAISDTRLPVTASGLATSLRVDCSHSASSMVSTWATSERGGTGQPVRCASDGGLSEPSVTNCSTTTDWSCQRASRMTS